MSLRHSENGPFLADFRPERNPIPWPRCCLASRLADGALSVDHFGGEYESVFGLDDADTRRWTDPSDRFACLFGSLAEALNGRRPVEKDGFCEHGHRKVLYRSVLLPFVDLRGLPAYVLGAFTSSTS
jgi:hypothetical protein